jgi:hypothetical protein
LLGFPKCLFVVVAAFNVGHIEAVPGAMLSALRPFLARSLACRLPLQAVARNSARHEATASTAYDRWLQEEAKEDEGAEADEDLPVRKLCSMGTGEQVQILSYSAKEGMVDEFEHRVQALAFKMLDEQRGVSDVRVCHPRCGEVAFVVTLVSKAEGEAFQRRVLPQLTESLADVVEGAGPEFARSGSLMPRAHTLDSLLAYLKPALSGRHYSEHDTVGVRAELSRWFPRSSEYSQYVHWDTENPEKYTRNVVHSSEDMEVLLMCWPPHSKSSIHCHDGSSCWVAAVEGVVHEVQFVEPAYDKSFVASQLRDPTGAVGSCGELKVLNVQPIGKPSTPTTTYTNNSIGLHRIENRSDYPAITMHVYAPRLRKMKIFRENADGTAQVTIAAMTYMSEAGEKTGLWGRHTDPDGVIDAAAWNSESEARNV